MISFLGLLLPASFLLPLLVSTIAFIFELILRRDGVLVALGFIDLNRVAVEAGVEPVLREETRRAGRAPGVRGTR